MFSLLRNSGTLCIAIALELIALERDSMPLLQMRIMVKRASSGFYLVSNTPSVFPLRRILFTAAEPPETEVFTLRFLCP